jgi:hypothetical protein
MGSWSNFTRKNQYSLQGRIVGVSAANASQLAADDRISSIAVSDTSAHVQNNLDALAAVNPRFPPLH